MFKKAKGKEAKLCYMGHVLMENRSGLVVDCRLTQANGTAERKAALEMIESLPGTGRITVGADKGYDAASRHADEDRDENASGILAGHYPFGEGSCEQT